MPMHDATIVAAIVAAFTLFGIVLFAVERSERKRLRQTGSQFAPHAALANDDHKRRAA